MRQIHPRPAVLDDGGLAALHAYPDPPGHGQVLRANMIASADGAATLAGRSGGLATEADRDLFALLRALADVVIVGVGTVRAENYRPARSGGRAARWAWLREGRPAAPPIAVVTRTLDLDPASPLFTQARPGARTILCTTGAAPASLRATMAQVAEVIVVGDHSVDMTAMAAELAARGHRRLLTEGGPRLLGQISAAGLLDELCLTISPLIAGPGPGRIIEPLGPVPGRREGRGTPLALAHVLEDEGALFCRYTRSVARPPAPDRKTSARS